MSENPLIEELLAVPGEFEVGYEYMGEQHKFMFGRMCHAAAQSIKLLQSRLDELSGAETGWGKALTLRDENERFRALLQDKQTMLRNLAADRDDVRNELDAYKGIMTEIHQKLKEAGILELADDGRTPLPIIRRIEMLIAERGAWAEEAKREGMNAHLARVNETSLETELEQIDGILARRPIFDGLQTRWAKIEKTIETAKQVDSIKAGLLVILAMYEGNMHPRIKESLTNLLETNGAKV